MNSQLLKIDTPTLQSEAITLLEEVSLLISRYSNSPENRYQDYQQQIENQKRLVEDLELRMAIVAPMKAGKSTIINAIIGQELVPSHNDARSFKNEIAFEEGLGYS